MNPSQPATELDLEHPIYKSLCDTIKGINQTIAGLVPGEDDDTAESIAMTAHIHKSTCATLAVGLAMDFDAIALLPHIMDDFGLSGTAVERAMHILTDIANDKD